jgi:Protein of unknown function (DUF1579)
MATNRVKTLVAVRLSLCMSTIAGLSPIAFAQQPRPAAPAPAPASATTPVAARPTSPAPAAPAAAQAAPAAAGKPAPTPSAAAVTGPPAPKPPAELDQMKVLEGTWRCEGRAPASAAGPEHGYKSTWKFKRDLDNFWWAAEYQQAKGKTNPTPMKARGYLTYDPATKSFVMLGVDNGGGTSTESSSGWSGDTVTLAGDASMGGRKIPFREVITRRGDHEFTWRGEMRTASDWVTLGEDRCKK